MRRGIIFGSSFAAILMLAYLWPMIGGSTVNGNARGAMCVAGHCCCAGVAEAKQNAREAKADTRTSCKRTR